MELDVVFVEFYKFSILNSQIVQVFASRFTLRLITFWGHSKLNPLTFLQVIDHLFQERIMKRIIYKRIQAK